MDREDDHGEEVESEEEVREEESCSGQEENNEGGGEKDGEEVGQKAGQEVRIQAQGAGEEARSDDAGSRVRSRSILAPRHGLGNGWQQQLTTLILSEVLQGGVAARLVAALASLRRLRSGGHHCIAAGSPIALPKSRDGWPIATVRGWQQSDADPVQNRPVRPFRFWEVRDGDL